MATLPNNVSVGLLHPKDTDQEERTILPITIYDAIMSAPNVVTDPEETPGAPFHLLAVEQDEMSLAEIRKFCGPII